MTDQCRRPSRNRWLAIILDIISFVQFEPYAKELRIIMVVNILLVNRILIDKLAYLNCNNRIVCNTLIALFIEHLIKFIIISLC